MSDPFQLISAGNTGVVCPKQSRPQAEKSFELWEPLCFYRPTVAKTRIERRDLFSFALGVKKISLFFLLIFFDQLFWRLNGIQMFSLWSCVLDFLFKLDHMSCECSSFFIVSCLKNCLPTLHHCHYTECPAGRQYIPKGWALFVFLETNFGFLIFP